MPYLPFSERTPDNNYRNLLRRVLAEGEYTRNPHQDKGTYTLLTAPDLVYPFANGFPVITDRKISFWRKAIAELLVFMHGARTLSDMERLGGKDWPSWWSSWVYPEKCAQFGLSPGDMGPGSYGPAYHNFPVPGGGEFNQFEHLIKQVKEAPALRTHLVTSWVPSLTLGHKGHPRQVVVAPCHGTAVKITIINGKLTLTHVQRSADIPVGVPTNIIQYAALALMIAQVVGVEAHQYIHKFLDAQVYEDQMMLARELVEREPLKLPTLSITDQGVRDLFEFRPEHFVLSDYDPHPAMTFPTTE